MKALLFVYESMAEFEIANTAVLLNTKADLKTFGIKSMPVKGAGGLFIIPELSIEEVKPAEYEALIIPGGNPSEYLQEKRLFELINDMNSARKTLAAICAGPVALARAGVLSGRNFTMSDDPSDYSFFPETGFYNDYIIVDKKIITAKAEGYVEFAIAIGDSLGLFADSNDRKTWEDLFRHH